MMTYYQILVNPPTHIYKSCGPDQCHPYALHAISESLVVPLTLLYNKSLTQGTLPKAWKEAIAVSIPALKRAVNNKLVITDLKA